MTMELKSNCSDTEVCFNRDAMLNINEINIRLESLEKAINELKRFNERMIADE